MGRGMMRERKKDNIFVGVKCEVLGGVKIRRIRGSPKKGGKRKRG